MGLRKWFDLRRLREGVVRTIFALCRCSVIGLPDPETEIAREIDKLLK
jgi:hypothetical protein